MSSPTGSDHDEYSSLQPTVSPKDSGEGYRLLTFPEIGKNACFSPKERGFGQHNTVSTPKKQKKHSLNLKLLTKRHVTEVTGLKVKGICYLVTSTKKKNLVTFGKSLSLPVFSCKIRVLTRESPMVSSTLTTLIWVP